MLISQADIDAARRRIAPYLAITPVVKSRHYSDRLGIEVFLKLETLHPTHSFKVRGAFNAILALPEDQRRHGVIAASGGNHGLGVALVCATLGIPARIYLPTSTPRVKIDAINQLGAEVTLHGSVWDEANQLALRAAREQDRAYIHPFDNTDVMAGQATVACEILEQISPVDVIITSIGGGGLISGILSAVHHYSPATRVFGVETSGADSMAQSVAAGQLVTLPAITSIAESLGAKRTEERQFQIVSRHASGLAVVSDDAAIDALVELLKTEKLLVEPATSCCLAALTGGKIALNGARRAAIILCGANIALEKVSAWITAAHKLPSD